jgi:hypothetical protein
MLGDLRSIATEEGGVFRWVRQKLYRKSQQDKQVSVECEVSVWSRQFSSVNKLQSTGAVISQGEHEAEAKVMVHNDGEHLVDVEVKLWPTVSRPVRLGNGLPSEAHDQISSSSFL